MTDWFRHSIYLPSPWSGGGTGHVLHKVWVLILILAQGGDVGISLRVGVVCPHIGFSLTLRLVRIANATASFIQDTPLFAFLSSSLLAGLAGPAGQSATGLGPS